MDSSIAQIMCHSKSEVSKLAFSLVTVPAFLVDRWSPFPNDYMVCGIDIYVCGRDLVQIAFTRNCPHITSCSKVP